MPEPTTPPTSPTPEAVAGAVETAQAAGYAGWAGVNRACRSLGIWRITDDPETWRDVALRFGFAREEL